MEKIIVGLIVVTAIAFLIRRIIRSVKSKGCCSGGEGGCSSCKESD